MPNLLVLILSSKLERGGFSDMNIGDGFTKLLPVIGTHLQKH